MWWSFIPYLAGKEKDTKASMGGDLGDYAAYRFLGKDKDMSWLDVVNPLTAHKGSANLLDPFGDLGLNNLFGDKKKKKDPKIAGKTQEEWVNTLGMDDEEYQTNLTELIRTISTGAAESRNKVSEINAMNNAPLATQLASERGVAIKANEAAVEGQTRLTQLQEQMNRQAEQVALQMFAQKESNDEAYLRMQEQQTTQSMGALLNMLGQYLGEQYFGNSVPGSTNNISTIGQTDYDAYGDYSQYA